MHILFFLYEDNMANFEVDLLLREIGVGEEVVLQVLYNPIGKQ